MAPTVSPHRGRSDVHSPVNLVTEDYEYIFAADLQSPWMLGMNQTDSGRAFIRELQHLDPATAERGFSQCHHCGARLRYCAWLRHAPTGYYIVVGETCLDNRFGRATVDFQRLRKQAELDRAAHRIRMAVAEFCEANEDLAFMGVDNVDEIPEPSRHNSFVKDVARRLRQYGSISQNQIDAIRRSLIKDAERAAERAEKAENPEPPAKPVPTGRVTIEGTVVSRKWKDSEYGGSMKITIKGAAGWRVWVTEPSSFESEVGDVIRLTCEIHASDNDVTFGFGKRPSKAVVLTTEQLALELADDELTPVTEAILARADDRDSLRFAIPSGGDNDLDFLAVFKGRVERHVGAPGVLHKWALAAPQALTLAKRIVELDDQSFVQAQSLYGQAMGRCGRCGAPLTDLESRTQFFGPECQKHVGDQ